MKKVIMILANLALLVFAVSCACCRTEVAEYEPPIVCYADTTSIPDIDAGIE